MSIPAAAVVLSVKCLLNFLVAEGRRRRYNAAMASTRWLGNLAVATLSTVLTLAAIELLCRLFLPGWAPAKAERIDFWQHDSLLGWSHRPGMSGVFEHRDFRVEVAINSLGLRDGEYPRHRIAGMKRWLLVGDSFAWGYGVEQDQTLDAVLEARHADLEFINAGVAGYGTDQQYLYLKHRGLELAPDVVVLLLHPNDLRNNAFARQYGYPKPYFRLAKEPSGRDRLHLEGTPVPAPSWSTRAERYLLRHTYFPRRVLLFLDELGDAPRPVTPAAEAQALTRRLLLAILDIVRGQGAELAVVNVPWDDPVTSGRIASLSRAVERQGGTWISLREAFAKARGETMFPHNQHWNAYGQRLAALEIERVLLASEPLQTGEVGGRESRK